MFLLYATHFLYREFYFGRAKIEMQLLKPNNNKSDEDLQ